jgi:chromosome segregation ATPase
MNEEITQNLPDKRSFEERVFARFDAFDVRFDSIEARLEKLESRNYDTKPIWERALAEITETRAQMNVRFGTLEKKVQAIETKVAAMATKVEVIEARVGALESQLAGLRSDFAGMRHELVDTQHEFKRTLTRLLESLFSFLTDTRELMLDNDARLKQLESKLA